MPWLCVKFDSGPYARSFKSLEYIQRYMYRITDVDQGSIREVIYDLYLLQNKV